MTEKSTREENEMQEQKKKEKEKKGKMMWEKRHLFKEYRTQKQDM